MTRFTVLDNDAIQQDNDGEVILYEDYLILQQKFNTLENAVRKTVLDAKKVVANASNTKAVKTGHELSGYTKHYIVPTYRITALKNLVRENDDWDYKKTHK